jgi:hypothetical protein
VQARPFPLEASDPVTGDCWLLIEDCDDDSDDGDDVDDERMTTSLAMGMTSVQSR